MLPYGLPRYIDIECPDMADIRRYGLKSSISHIPGKSGDIRNSFRKPSRKKQIRRYWKKVARSEAKDMISCEQDMAE